MKNCFHALLALAVLTSPLAPLKADSQDKKRSSVDIENVSVSVFFIDPSNYDIHSYASTWDDRSVDRHFLELPHRTDHNNNGISVNFTGSTLEIEIKTEDDERIALYSIPFLDERAAEIAADFFRTHLPSKLKHLIIGQFETSLDFYGERAVNKTIAYPSTVYVETKLDDNLRPYRLSEIVEYARRHSNAPPHNSDLGGLEEKQRCAFERLCDNEKRQPIPPGGNIFILTETGELFRTRYEITKEGTPVTSHFLKIKDNGQISQEQFETVKKSIRLDGIRKFSEIFTIEGESHQSAYSLLIDLNEVSSRLGLPFIIDFIGKIDIESVVIQIGSKDAPEKTLKEIFDLRNGQLEHYSLEHTVLALASISEETHQACVDALTERSRLFRRDRR